MTRARINPRVLAWAREQSETSRDEAAQRAGVRVARIDEWESGESIPTFRQLRVLAGLYKRPSAIFFLPEVPLADTGIVDFRRLGGEHEGRSRHLVHAIRAARFRRDTALEISRELGEEPIPFEFRARQGLPPEDLGRQIRDHVGVTFQQQTRWADRYLALREWVSAVESTGVLVCQFREVPIRHARGFSIDECPFPVIALNGSDSPLGRIFTLFHEFTHLTIGRGGLCDMHQEEQAEPNGDVETYCNKVAAEVLLPHAEFEEIVGGVLPFLDRGWNLGAVSDVATTFKVSREAVLVRLVETRLISFEVFGYLRELLYQQYLEERRNGSGFAQYYSKVLNDNGRRYTRLVLDAFHRDRLTATELSRSLGGIKLQHVPAIEGALGQG